MRRGFTVVELIIVVFIVAILALLIFGGVGGCSATGKSFYNVKDSGDYEVIKTYTFVENDQTSKRVDLRPVDGKGRPWGPAITVVCDDDWMAGVSNSATLYSQFQAGKIYKVSTVGFRREGWYACFPIVVSVVLMDDMIGLKRPAKAEADTIP